MVNLVVLDSYPYQKSEFERFKVFGNLIIYEDTSISDIAKRIDGADIVITNKVLLNEDVLKHNSSVKFVAVSATGYNVVDIQYLANNSSKLTYV